MLGRFFLLVTFQFGALAEVTISTVHCVMFYLSVCMLSVARYLLCQYDVPIISVFLLQVAQNFSLMLLLLVLFFI